MLYNLAASSAFITMGVKPVKVQSASLDVRKACTIFTFIRHVCMYVCVYVCMYVCTTYVCMYVCVCMYVRMSVCVCMHVCTYV